MIFLKNFHNKRLKHELLNKFNYRQPQDISKLKKIVLSFDGKTSELRTVAINLLALKLVAKQKGVLTQAKKANIRLKIRKGHPVGCKVTLRKKQMFKFVEKMITETFPTSKGFQKLKSKNNKSHTFSYQIRDPFSLPELRQHYHIFSNVSRLNITVIGNTKTNEEMLFLLGSLQLPLDLEK